MDVNPTSVGIIGAGISGLSAAYLLKKKGVEVTVFEKNDSSGGVIQTHSSNGWLVEEGPNTLLVQEQEVWDLLDELELDSQIQTPGPEAKKRYIIRDGRLCAAPMSFIDFLKTDLLSTSAKFRLLKEPFIAAPQKKDESIATFIRRRLGQEPLNYGINPFVSGIYAGDPNELSVKHTFSSLFEMEQKHGSIFKGFLKRDKDETAKKRLLSFDEGLKTLPNTLQKKLAHSVRCNTEVQKISKTPTGWSVCLKSGETINHRVLVSTLPAPQLSQVWPDSNSKKAIQQLAGIDYAPMSVLALGFEHNQINHPLDGFGMLIPEAERFSLLGCLFSSSLFPNRAPEGHALLTCFLGGARHRKLAARPYRDLIQETLPQLNQLLGIDGEPVFTRHRYWPKAIPQYTVGYDNYLQSMKQIETANSGFFLAGNYRGGVSVPDCIINGFKTANQVVNYLK